jgi:hypothetical protein
MPMPELGVDDVYFPAMVLNVMMKPLSGWNVYEVGESWSDGCDGIVRNDQPA